MTAYICTLIGAVFGALSVAIIHYGDVGSYEVGDDERPSGWVHDGELYVHWSPPEGNAP